ncbi:hypothetical protein M427DRAFT_154157 [Gonapodya prolifera JEL478]|uniref:Uncharacterized protein n=1 Tax=Gonapodya prolifera (strain JEL478) TaxID=1344416 RepID=A0A139AJR7_GONPJ|nr:hypothetical protein M427DRAFT_154157 [Gonapodya prolifera JEL478]|eukprot:KXS17050.1 hypothetical protein M427DRAFT_154157 [Gonapodya prolifera JEL478]
MHGVDPNLWGNPDYFKIVTTETMKSVNDRVEAYLEGGVLATTSWILLADFLNEVVPVHLYQGFLVARAEHRPAIMSPRNTRIDPLSIESFILRLFRMHNKCGFIKAFSD